MYKNLLASNRRVFHFENV
ncbi:hypothetical protein FWK35_00017406 [Aphis craccivora]|uniref:Uncharacterized protein n=1 Tax=Aphis craccivora TaxID=307492 RepID=A0A6G0YMW7_APHCR|nr:hypothetical protein FWK35_00017406 [Aphis craccivora]